MAMAQRSDSITFFGYHSQETDFNLAVARLSQAHRDVIDKIPKIIFNVQLDPEATSFCSITILGLADRDDTPGLTAEQRRDNESTASFTRAVSFEQFLLDEVNGLFQAFGNPQLASFDLFDRVFVHSEGIGSSQLTFKTPQNETERRRNRRLQLVVATVNMGIIDDADPKILDASS
jgi:hypothetical protein